MSIGIYRQLGGGGDQPDYLQIVIHYLTYLAVTINLKSNAYNEFHEELNEEGFSSYIFERSIQTKIVWVCWMKRHTTVSKLWTNVPYQQISQ
jgi:hypothetical protein